MAQATKRDGARARKSLTQDRLKEVLSYDFETGLFKWMVATAHRITIADVAGCRNPTDKYIYIRIDGHLYAAHRLALLYTTGAWPEHEIDHVNNDRSDNRWQNLRPATRQQNSHNRSVGPCVRLHKRGRKRWQAAIKVNGIGKSLGYFLEREEAEAAYWHYVQKTRGEFARLP